MGAALRLCVRAWVLAGMTSVCLSLSLPGCQFPDYGMANGNGGSAGMAAGGAAYPEGGTADDGGEPGTDAGSPSAGSGTAGAAGAEIAPEPCPDPQACVPRPPRDWLGPKAFWEGRAGLPEGPPACPEGYAKPTDLHYGINEPTGGCDCTCSAVNQACGTNTVVHIHPDMMCKDMACSNSTLTGACTGVTGCTGSQGSIEAAKPTPTGGSCKPDVSKRPDATWKNDSRICEPSGAYVCDDPTQVCAPTPPRPYASQLCITRLVTAGHTIPTCPADYPSQTLLYEEMTDDRGCTACSCSGVTGGSCSGTLKISTKSDCSTPGFEYALGGGCANFNLGSGNIHPTTILAEYTVTPGACTVTTPSKPDDMHAHESGPVTVVCCP